MKYKSKLIIKFENIIIPTIIYKEMRMDVRVSILKDKAIIRIPIFYTKGQVNKNNIWAKEWIIKHIKNNPEIKNRFKVKEYSTGDLLNINNQTFTLEIYPSTNKNYSAKLNGTTIIITTPTEINNILDNQKAIKTLQSRVVAQYFQKEITDRINLINNNFFNASINKIRLKYNKTNWGSRSDKNNINISTRLLFAPKEVQDYVFIHELAHFKEMNHSSKFWAIVKNVMPNYKKHEKWLKENGAKCDF